MLLRSVGGAADCYRSPKDCPAIWTNISAASPNITLDWQECFKYHYLVDLPVKFINGTDYSIQSQYWSTGTCAEATSMSCNESSLVQMCVMMFYRAINVTTPATSTMAMKMGYMETPVWSLNATLAANATDTQTFSGTQQCPDDSAPAIDPKPSACGKPLTVESKLNPFYFTAIKFG